MLLIIFVFCVCGFCAIVRLLCPVCLMLSVSVNAFGLFTCNDIAEKMLIVAIISHCIVPSSIVYASPSGKICVSRNYVTTTLYHKWFKISTEVNEGVPGVE